jgi:microcystin-dependent protein
MTSSHAANKTRQQWVLTCRREGDIDMAEPFIGEIRLVAFDYPPSGWLQANGQLLPVQQYAALFALYGVTFGGNGTTNFALPDLRGRTPVGISPPAHSQGSSQGSETVTLNVDSMPQHTHVLSGNTGPASQLTGAANYLASVTQSSSPNMNLYQPVNAAAAVALIPAGIGTVGSGAAHENMQPFLTIDFLVATTGIWPPRP